MKVAMFRMKTLVLFPVLALAFAGCGGPSVPGSAANSSQTAPDTTPPTAPTGLSATATSSVQTSLAWVAATDNVGVTGYRVERCQGASCSNFVQIAAPASTTSNDTGLSASTSYSYRVRAADAAGNLGAYSNITSATTPAPDTSAPTAPTGLTATAASSTQINLTWTASTDNVGVTGYRVERCQGASCSNFVQIAAPASTTSNDTGLSASTSYSYRVRAADAAGNLGAYSNITSATTLPPAPPPPGAQDFPTRCNAPGVLRCVAFDAPSEISGAYGSNSGIISGNSTNPTIDTTVKASGAGSLKFTIPTLSGENSSGAYFTNFSNDLLTQFGENQEFYVQWRQRFSPEFVNTFYTSAGGGGANGWKQIIIGSGDQPGCNSGNAVSPPCYASCTDLETVVQNTGQRKFPQMYNSCTGSTSHSAFDNFYVFVPATSDFKLQNARPSPFCLYSQSGAGYFPPGGNCVGYIPNTWMTFQIKIKTGPRLLDEWINSSITLWVAQESQASQLVIDFFPYNLTAGAPASDQKFGKVWLLPFHTNKSNTQSTPEAYTWYDELIISTTPIADPL